VILNKDYATGGLEFVVVLISNGDLAAAGPSFRILLQVCSIIISANIFDSNGVKTPQLNTRNFYHAGTFIMDMQIGFRYDWISCDECYHLGFDLGWEHHYHPGLNQFILFVNNAMTGKFVINQCDLAAQGYYVKVRFDF